MSQIIQFNLKFLIQIFSDNFREVERHNHDVKYKWTKGINKYSDLTSKIKDNLRILF